MLNNPQKDINNCSNLRKILSYLLLKNVEQGRSWGHVFDKYLIPFELHIISQHKSFVRVPKSCKIFQKLEFTIQCFIEHIKVKISSFLITIMFIKLANVVVFYTGKKPFCEFV